MSAQTISPIDRSYNTFHVVRRDAWLPDDLRHKIAAWSPQSQLGQIVRECFRYLPAEQVAELLERITSCVVVESSLAAVAIRNRASRYWSGEHREDYGIVGRRVVTTAGVGFIVDAFQNIVELEIMKYHALGTGSTAEAVGDTALVTELTTEYTGNVRATGTTTEASATVYQTVATNTLDSGTPAVIEHGIFSASSAGVLLDRTKFGGSITLDGTVGDGLTTTYSLTCSAGG